MRVGALCGRAGAGSAVDHEFGGRLGPAEWPWTVNCLAQDGFARNKTRCLRKEGVVAYLCDRIPVKRTGRPEDLDGGGGFWAGGAEGQPLRERADVAGGGGISTGGDACAGAGAPTESDSKQEEKRVRAVEPGAGGEFCEDG